MRRTIRRSRRLALVIATTSTIALGTSPALATPPEHAQANGQRDRGDEVTEDTDRNDGGTPEDVADAGDNAHPSGRDRSVEPGSGSQGNAQHDPDDDGKGPDRSNGGVDQPGGEGGVDKADQDRNNGCGNDDDFEDDNEGLCGGAKGRTAGRDDEDLDEQDEVEVDDATDDDTTDDDADRDGDVVVYGDTGDTGSDVGAGVADTGTDTDTDRDAGPWGVLGDVVVRTDDEQTAGADTDTNGETSVLGVSLDRTPANAPDTVSAEAAGVASVGALARTGTDALVLAVMGVTSLAGGAAALRRRR